MKIQKSILFFLVAAAALPFASCAVQPTVQSEKPSITTESESARESTAQSSPTIETTTLDTTSETADPMTLQLQLEERTDITDTLGKAINDAKAGSLLVLPAGEYYISDRIKLRSNIVITGSGMDKTLLTVTRNGMFSAFWADGKESITLGNFAVNGANMSMKTVIDLENCTSITIDALAIHDLNGKDSSIAIHFQGTTDSTIKNCVFRNISVASEWGCAVRLSHKSSRNKVVDNKISDTGRGGILCDNDSTHLTLSGNTISGSGKTAEALGIEIWGGCDYSIIEDNVIDHWLSIDRSSYSAVRRNIISDKTGTVKFLGLEVVGSTDVICTDNLIDHGQYIGLSASNTEPKDYTYWGNNQVYGCQQWGAQFQGEEGYARHQYFYNLTIADTYKDRDPIYPNDAGAGFRFNDNCEYFMFEGGRIADNATLGIQLLGHVEHVYFLDTVFENNPEQKESVLAARRVSLDKLPVVNFTCETNIKAGEPVSFINKSDGKTGDIEHVLWDFGAGLPSSDFDSTYTYEKAGTYTVSLIVWNTAGYAYRSERILTVAEP